MNIEVGDWVLHRCEYGKIWKLCEVLRSDMYDDKIFYYLKNIKSKSPYGFQTYGTPIIIPVPKNSNIENMNIKTLVTLYANPNKDEIDQQKFFEPSKQHNIQINCKNKNLINKILSAVENIDDVELEKVKHKNVNIAAKYELKEKRSGE